MNQILDLDVIDLIYRDTLFNLRALIESHEVTPGTPGSISQFAKHIGIDNSNLTKFVNNNSRHDMSVGTFLRIMVGLGWIKDDMVSENQKKLKISIKEYMTILHNPIFESILRINYS